MTTHTKEGTASQAPAVTIDTTEFREKLQAHLLQLQRTMGLQGDKRADLIAHIDAKLAQARASGVMAANDFRQLVSDSDTAEIKEWKARATTAEAKLKTIRGTVKSLVGYGDEHASFISRANVLALLEQRSETDESGLPG